MSRQRSLFRPSEIVVEPCVLESPDASEGDFIFLEAAPRGEYGFGTVGMAHPDEAIAAAVVAAERAGYADKYDLSAGWLDSVNVRASSTVRFRAK